MPCVVRFGLGLSTTTANRVLGPCCVLSSPPVASISRSHRPAPCQSGVHSAHAICSPSVGTRSFSKVMAPVLPYANRDALYSQYKWDHNSKLSTMSTCNDYAVEITRGFSGRTTDTSSTLQRRLASGRRRAKRIFARPCLRQGLELSQGPLRQRHCVCASCGPGAEPDRVPRARRRRDLRTRRFALLAFLSGQPCDTSAPELWPNLLRQGYCGIDPVAPAVRSLLNQSQCDKQTRRPASCRSRSSGPRQGSLATISSRLLL